MLLRALGYIAAGYGLFYVAHTKQGQKIAQEAGKLAMKASGLASSSVGKAVAKTLETRQNEGAEIHVSDESSHPPCRCKIRESSNPEIFDDTVRKEASPKMSVPSTSTTVDIAPVVPAS